MCSLFWQTSSLRADDHSTIGAILFAVLTPAVFWNRARVAHCVSNSIITSSSLIRVFAVILGGAGIGSGVGLLAHYGRTVTGDAASRVDMPGPVVPS